jgi:hypothetical protein
MVEIIKVALNFRFFKRTAFGTTPKELIINVKDRTLTIVDNPATWKKTSNFPESKNKTKYKRELTAILKVNIVEQSIFLRSFSFTRLPPSPESINVFAIVYIIARTPMVPKSWGVKSLVRIMFVTNWIPAGVNLATNPQTYIDLCCIL